MCGQLPPHGNGMTNSSLRVYNVYMYLSMVMVHLHVGLRRPLTGANDLASRCGGSAAAPEEGGAKGLQVSMYEPNVPIIVM